MKTIERNAKMNRTEVGSDEWLLGQCEEFERMTELDGMPFNIRFMLKTAERVYRMGVLKGDELIQAITFASLCTNDPPPRHFAVTQTTFEDALSQRKKTVASLFLLIGAVGTERMLRVMKAQ